MILARTRAVRVQSFNSSFLTKVGLSSPRSNIEAVIAVSPSGYAKS